MANICRGLFQKSRNPQLHIVRNKSKVSITKPKPPHDARALVEQICKPYFSEVKKECHVPNYDTCNMVKVTEEERHPAEVVFAREAFNWFSKSRLIAFFHRNLMEPEEDFKARLLLKKNNIRFKSFNKRIIKLALTGTIYEPVLPLFKSSTVMGFSEDPGEDLLHKLQNISPKLPKLVLLAAVFESRLLSHSEIEYFGQFTTLQEVRSKLVGTLNLASQNLVQQLNQHPSNLVQLLQQHQEINKGKPGKN